MVFNHLSSIYMYTVLHDCNPNSSSTVFLLIQMCTNALSNLLVIKLKLAVRIRLSVVLVSHCVNNLLERCRCCFFLCTICLCQLVSALLSFICKEQRQRHLMKI